MADPLASLPTNPACYGTSDIARLRESVRDLAYQRDQLFTTLADVLGKVERDGERVRFEFTACHCAPPGHARGISGCVHSRRSRTEQAIHDRLAAAWPYLAEDPVHLEQIAYQAADAALSVEQEIDPPAFLLTTGTEETP